jgi:hypothetical protein
MSGTASCLDNVANDGGAPLGEGQPCSNAPCADGLDCAGMSGSAPTCTMLCLTPGAVYPFDAGQVDAKAPFLGGCSNGKTCSATPLGPDGGPYYPAWVSYCN